MLNKKKKTRLRELARCAQEASAELQNQKHKVNALSNWLNQRNSQNSFGLDFEYTLRPRRDR